MNGLLEAAQIVFIVFTAYGLFYVKHVFTEVVMLINDQGYNRINIVLYYMISIFETS